jgi:lipoprotein-anchoring transpeptidase ErfK/SrfK
MRFGKSPSITRRKAATVGVIVLALAVTMSLDLTGEKHAPSERAAPPRSAVSTVPASGRSTTTSAPAAARARRVATSQVDRITAYDRPSRTAHALATLSRTTDYGVPRTFLVVDDREDGDADRAAQPGWLRVLLPVRPNGTTGWIDAAQVHLASTDFSVTVQLGAHRVTVYEGERTVLQTDAVIGSPETPTPLGTFYVTDPVDRQSAPDTVYGAFALGLSGFSEVLTHFEGGPAQIALHGTNRPDQLGQAISNGCLRVPNDVIVRIAHTVPLGTPVHIVA